MHAKLDRTSLMTRQQEIVKELVKDFVDAGNERDYSRIDDLVAEGFVRHCQATPDLEINTREQFKAFMKDDAAVFPDSHVTVQQLE